MRSNCVAIGDADAAGNREFTFKVQVNRQPLLYQVTAHSEDEAKDRLRTYVEGDAMAVQQQLGAVGGVASIVIVGAVAYGVYLIAQHVKRLIPHKRPKTIGSVKAAPAAKTGAARAGAFRSGTSGATRSGAGVRTAATSSAPRAASSPRAATTRRTVVNGGTDGAPEDEAQSARPFARKSATWRPIQYNGFQGQLGAVAGVDPTKAIQVMVFSDTPVEPLLSLARAGSYDSATSRLSSAIVVMSFPAAVGSQMRPTPDALEIMIGDEAQSRAFDLRAPTVEAALDAVKAKLAEHL